MPPSSSSSSLVTLASGSSSSRAIGSIRGAPPRHWPTARTMTGYKSSPFMPRSDQVRVTILSFSLRFSTRYSIEGKFNSRGLRYDREREESSDSKLKFIIPFEDTLFLIVVEQMKFFSNLCVSFRHAISSDGIYRNISNGERICARNFELFSRENNFMEG